MGGEGAGVREERVLGLVVLIGWAVASALVALSGRAEWGQWGCCAR